MRGSARPTLEIVRKHARRVDVLQYFSCRRFFAELYDAVKKESGKYSYRAFSADLGYGETNFMHLVCSGKRRISPTTARDIATRLDLSQSRKKYFLALVRFDNAKNPYLRNQVLEELAAIIEETLPTRLDRDQFAYFSNWQNAVIRELATRPDFEADPHWIARTISPPLSPDRAAESLALLVRIGYLKPDPNTGKLVPAEVHVRSPKEAKSAALFRFHNQLIELGRTSMSRIDGWRRDISSVTVRVDEDTTQQIKTEIQAFRARILELSEKCSAEGKQVYQLNIQLFPFTEVD